MTLQQCLSSCYLKQVTIPLSFAIVLFGGCSQPTAPTGKSPRDMAWEKHEMSNPNFDIIPRGVFGVSATRAFLVCNSNSAITSKLFEFSNGGWIVRDIFSPPFATFDLNAIDGSGSNDIWALGVLRYFNPNGPPTYTDSSLAYRYNGAQWQEIALVPRGGSIECVAAVSSSNVWFGGVRSTLYHYDGHTARLEDLSLALGTGSLQSMTVTAIAASEQGHVYLALNDGVTGRFRVLRGTIGSWTQIDSGFASCTSLWVSPSGRLYATFYGYGVYLWTGSAWSAAMSDPRGSLCVTGTHDSNILVGGESGSVFHFDGNDWIQLAGIEEPTGSIANLWMDNSTAFVVGLSLQSGTGFVYLGK
jgi:hypothetical protein